MIAYLKGQLKHKQAPRLLLEVHGVGYELEAPMTTFYDLPDVGQSLELHVHMVVREDAQLLYGFSTLAQRDMFRLLLKVNGVGPRVALAILSGLTAEAFSTCIANDDLNQLIKIPGIGRKTAQRLIVEMQDKLTLREIGDFSADMSMTGASAQNDAISALMALGYKATEATRAVKQVQNPGTDSESLIRSALRQLS